MSKERGGEEEEMGSVCMWEGYKRVWEGEGEVVHICREERHGGSDS